MSETQAKFLHRLRAKVAKFEHEDTDAPDERDETIARLERDIEAERENAASLRKTIDEQHFRIEILEQSYSKQLDDARTRAETAEQALANEKARATELEATCTTLTKQRDEARRELEHTTQRERMQFSLESASLDTRPADVARGARGNAASARSIDDILTEASIVDPKDQANRPRNNGHLDAQVSDDGDHAGEEMLSPDLVFNENDRDGNT